MDVPQEDKKKEKKMKKLIMCVAAVLSACALNAANVDWGVADLFDDNYDSLVGTITLASADGTVTSGPIAIDGGTVDGTFSNVDWGTDPFNTGSAWKMTARIQDANGDFYEQVFDVALGTIDPADDRANMAAFEGLTIDAQSAMLPNLTLDTTDMAGAGWTPSSGGGGGGGGVPEPTSGLLLAFGGAMLALRRRHA